MPALHWAITSSGPETMNSGEPITGRRRRSRRTGGRAMAALWISSTNRGCVARRCQIFPSGRFLFADKMQNDLAPVRRAAMLEQIDALPGAEHHLPDATGIESWVCVSAARIWLGMSSGPSASWI